MKNRIIGRWNLMRLIRLALGIFIVIQGIVTHEWIFAIMGGLFALMPLFNIGCCGAAGCNTAGRGMSGSGSAERTTDVSYEEIH